MPDLVLNNQGVWGYTPTSNVEFAVFLNAGATAIKPGDVVWIGSGANADGVRVLTGTTAGSPLAIGVAANPVPTDSVNTYPSGTSYAAGKTVPVILRGVARVNIGAGTVALADALGQGATAGVAATQATPTAGAVIAIALQANTAADANGTILAYVMKV